MHRIYHKELKIRDTTDTVRSSSYLAYTWKKKNSLPNYTTNTMTSQLSKICGITSALDYGVFISQLKRYARSYGSYADFFHNARLLTIRLLEQGYVASRLK